MLHIHVYSANLATLSCRRSKRNAAKAAEGAAALRVVPAGGPMGRAGGPVRASPRVRHTCANPHELASNNECTRTRCCRACWNGTGTALNRASWNGSSRNMQRICSDM